MRRILLFFLFSFLLTEKPFAAEIVAKLDGKPITMDELRKYAKKLENVNPKYSEMLKTKKGTKELLHFYIRRKILLEEAKKKVSKDDPVFLSHKHRFPEETALLITYITYLNRKFEKEIRLDDKEVQKYAKEKGIPLEIARRELIVEKKKKLVYNFLQRLEKLHQVQILIP